jgi:hypothetical protein
MAKYGEKASEKVEKSDAREERRNTQKWTIRQEGEKPQTGDRHRTVGSPTRWGQGSAPEIFVEKEVNSENHSDHFRQMKSQAIRCLRDLLPATEPVGYNQSLGRVFMYTRRTRSPALIETSWCCFSKPKAPTIPQQPASTVRNQARVFRASFVDRSST